MIHDPLLLTAAENMTRGIVLRPRLIRGEMAQGERSACAAGTLRAGAFNGNPYHSPTPESGEFSLAEALRARFAGSGIAYCNDQLHIEREAMIQVACEDAGLAG